MHVEISGTRTMHHPECKLRNPTYSAKMQESNTERQPDSSVTLASRILSQNEPGQQSSPAGRLGVYEEGDFDMLSNIFNKT